MTTVVHNANKIKHMNEKLPFIATNETQNIKSDAKYVENETTISGANLRKSGVKSLHSPLDDSTLRWITPLSPR